MSLEPKFFEKKIFPHMQHSNNYIYHLKNEKEKRASPGEPRTIIFKFTFMNF